MDTFAKEIMTPARRPAAYARVYANGVDDIWAMDLAAMPIILRDEGGGKKDSNDGYTNILVAVDVFSRYAWCIPLKTKTGTEVWAAFASIASKGKPHFIWVDKGGEFYNKTWDVGLKRLDIGRYSTENPMKVSIAERFIRTLKRMVWLRFYRDNTRRWIDILPEIVEAYNAHEHSALGMSPNRARTAAGERRLLARIKTSPVMKPKYHLNQWVRVSRVKGVFEKEFDTNYSMAIYKIVKIALNDPVHYYLVDYYGNPVAGTYYTEELLPVADHKFFPAEKVLKTRVVKGQTEKLTKLLGYKEPVWLAEGDVEDLPKEGS